MRFLLFIMIFIATISVAKTTYSQSLPPQVAPPYAFRYAPETPWGPMLQFRGNFVTGVKNDFIRMLELYPDTKIVSLESPGGLLTEGYDVGTVLSDNKLNVWVPRDGACISACALAFIGGWEYKVSGILAFHAPWLPKYEGDMKLMDIYSQGMMTGAAQSFWFALNGFRAQFFMTIAQFTNRDTFMILTNTQDLMWFLMHPERTYAEYLEVKPLPSSVLQGNGDLMSQIMERKRLEVLRNKGEFNFQSGTGKYPSYKEMQKLHQVQ